MSQAQSEGTECPSSSKPSRKCRCASARPHAEHHAMAVSGLMVTHGLDHSGHTGSIYKALLLNSLCQIHQRYNPALPLRSIQHLPARRTRSKRKQRARSGNVLLLVTPRGSGSTSSYIASYQAAADLPYICVFRRWPLQQPQQGQQNCKRKPSSPWHLKSNST